MWPDSKHKNKELKINAKHWQHNLSGMLTIIFSTSDLVVIEDLHQEALAARSFQTRRCWSSARQQWFPASLRFTSGHTLRGGTWRGVCGLEATALDLFPCVRGISAFLRTRGPAALPWPAAQRPFASQPAGPLSPASVLSCRRSVLTSWLARSVSNGRWGSGKLRVPNTAAAPAWSGDKLLSDRGRAGSARSMLGLVVPRRGRGQCAERALLESPERLLCATARSGAARPGPPRPP